MNEITLEALIENIPRAIEFIDEMLEKAGCSIKTQMQIDVAVDELLTNIAMYAYATGKGDMTMRLTMEDDPAAAVITFLDKGVPFNPLDRPEPDTTSPAAERPIGGLGIFLVRKTMDSMTYRRENGFNITTIRKAL